MITWNSALEVGIRPIDTAHQSLIEFINLVGQTSESQKPRPCDRKLLDDLRALLRAHFEKEEDLMFGINYPGVDKHILEHSTMLSRFDIMAANFHMTDQTNPVIEFISKWIVSHHETEDTNLASYIQKLKHGKTRRVRDLRPPSLSADANPPPRR
ncbi:MAG: hemerythrin domain-containing protein [Rhodospirillaceae bacterium]